MNHARSATLFTSRGKLRLTHRRYRRDFFPVDAACDCYCCQNFSRGYLRHLFNVEEMLGPTLISIHNRRLLLDAAGNPLLSLREKVNELN